MRVLDILETGVRNSIWPLVPEVFRRPLRRAAAILRGKRPPTASDLYHLDEVSRVEARYDQVVTGMKAAPSGGGYEISSPKSLSVMVDHALRAAQLGDGALVRYITSFQYRMPTQAASDPFSPEYRDFWLKQYELLSGRSYAIKNELHDFDEAGLKYRVYPYSTRDQKTVANHLIAAAAILEAIEAPPPAKVLEMGVGFGNTALQIAMTGYDVTVLDVEKKYLDNIQERFARENLHVRCLHMQFLDVSEIDDSFDVILFYECFHHCLEHEALLRLLKTKLSPGGVIIFAGETIEPDLPFAWGLNPSGQGVFSIRWFGWMELVFTERYFLDLLKRNGFSVVRNKLNHSAHSVVYTARLN
jgi:2-polyprenyl-3-methyl-5-hydroxy-6-metoxy-1,4-benzoquinol methylase